jgi:hypothetical protein
MGLGSSVISHASTCFIPLASNIGTSRFFLFVALYLDDSATPLLSLSDILSSLNRYNYPPLPKLQLPALVANEQSAFH